MRVTGWTEAVLRAQPARVIRAHFARIFAGLVWSPEVAALGRTPAPQRESYANLAAYANARSAHMKAREALDDLAALLWPED
jgi:hypothetical protein